MKSAKYLSLALAAFALIAPAQVFAADAAATTTIEIKDYTFAPDKMTVKAGESVTWVNHDGSPHAILGKDQSLKSETLGKDSKFTHTFSTPGTYTYNCSIHPEMAGTVTVQ